MARLTPIRLALLEDNRTQKWLADELGISEPAASRIVNGLAPDEETIAAICALLDRPESVLFPHLGAASHQNPEPSTPSSAEDSPNVEELAA